MKRFVFIALCVLTFFGCIDSNTRRDYILHDIFEPRAKYEISICENEETGRTFLHFHETNNIAFMSILLHINGEYVRVEIDGNSQYAECEINSDFDEVLNIECKIDRKYRLNIAFQRASVFEGIENISDFNPYKPFNPSWLLKNDPDELCISGNTIDYSISDDLREEPINKSRILGVKDREATIPVGWLGEAKIRKIFNLSINSLNYYLDDTFFVYEYQFRKIGHYYDFGGDDIVPTGIEYHAPEDIKKMMLDNARERGGIKKND